MNDELLKSLKGKNVRFGQTIHIQFFQNTGLTPVTYINSDHKDLPEFIENLIDNEEYIVLDLACDDDIYYESINPIAFFTIATSKGVLIIRNSGNNSPIMRTFLTTHTFYMKNVSSNSGKLINYLSQTFSSLKIIDVETAQFMAPLKLKKRHRNFETMVERCAGKPTASFKRRELHNLQSVSVLDVQQICRVAIDPIGLYESLIQIFKLQRSKPTPDEKEDDDKGN